MGSPKTESCRGNDEDQHPVILTHAFEITATETTQAQFRLVMGYNPSYFASCGDTCPVDDLTWNEAAAYCNNLSAMAKLDQCYTCSGSGASTACDLQSAYGGSLNTIYDCPGYRLPTEAEWEYAVRAGTQTSLYNGTLAICNKADVTADLIAWYQTNADSTTHPVGQKQANSWGLSDMSGNVWEWVNDYYQLSLGSAQVTDPWGPATGTQRVMRGGSYFDSPDTVRSASRLKASSTQRWGYLGFRCVRSR